MQSERLTTVPNAISLSRVVLAAAFVVLDDPHQRLALVLTAAATDFLDGFIARIANLRSKVGALLDPIADRIFVLCVVLVFLFEGSLTTTQYFILISRDLATAVGFLVAQMIPWLRPVAFRARLAGKIVTVLQLVTLVAVLVVPRLVPWLIVAIGILSAVSIIDYTLALWRARTRSISTD